MVLPHWGVSTSSVKTLLLGRIVDDYGDSLRYFDRDYHGFIRPLTWFSLSGKGSCRSVVLPSIDKGRRKQMEGLKDITMNDRLRQIFHRLCPLYIKRHMASIVVIPYLFIQTSTVCYRIIDYVEDGRFPNGKYSFISMTLSPQVL